MDETKEKVKLDEVLKYLFSTSNKVLVKLINSIFGESFETDEIEITISNNEFVEGDLGILRGDMFFDILDKDNVKASYHIEFQTRNDSTMVVRMFEYGFVKGKEQLRGYKEVKSNHDIRTIYFPRQKVIFFEENRNIKDTLNLRIVFPDGQDIIYKVDVMKYWQYTSDELKDQKMYPLIPLKLFSLRKELEKAQDKNDIEKIKKLSYTARELARSLAHEAKELFEADEILGDDFYRMLLAIGNLIEYLNKNYFNDEKIEDEVITMTKTLYDPEVEKRGVQIGLKQGVQKEKLNIAKNLLDVLDDETISIKTGLDMKVIKVLRKEVIK